MKKVLLIISIYFLTTLNAYSEGIMRSWAEGMKEFIDKPLISTFDKMYRSQGLVLVDFSNNFASYSFSANKLSVEERKNPGSVENKSNFILSFYTCGQDSSLNLPINQVLVKSNFEQYLDFHNNFQELIELSEENNWTRINYGKSQQRDDQVFLLWQDDKDKTTSIEIQINKETHNLVWMIYKTCQN